MSAEDSVGLEFLTAMLIELLLQGHTTPSTTPTRTSGSVPADAIPDIDNFRNDPHPTPSVFNLGPNPVQARIDFADRLRDLVTDPDKFDQRQLNACGSAAFFHVWLKRDPKAAARFAIDLFEQGHGMIGALDIRASPDLLAQDYMSLVRTFGADDAPLSADWVMMSAIRDGTRQLPRFLGVPSNDDFNNQTGFVHPQELCDWLMATGLYSAVVNKANAFGQKNFSDFPNLPLGATRDVFVLIHARMLASKNLLATCTCEEVAGAMKKNLINASTPDHYIVLEPPIDPLKAPIDDASDPDNVTLEFWCWADIYRQPGGSHPCMCMPYNVDRETFADNFYGGVIAVR
jgi:hypothetical protein